jgi:hypothetical protein
MNVHSTIVGPQCYNVRAEEISIRLFQLFQSIKSYNLGILVSNTQILFAFQEVPAPVLFGAVQDHFNFLYIRTPTILK